MSKMYVNKNGVRKEIIKVLESFNGDLYFFPEEPDANGYVLAYVRLYSMPEMAEWGEVNLPYLNSSEGYGANRLWEVKKASWRNLNSYEDGLVEFESEKKVVA